MIPSTPIPKGCTTSSRCNVQFCAPNALLLLTFRAQTLCTFAWLRVSPCQLYLLPSRPYRSPSAPLQLLRMPELLKAFGCDVPISVAHNTTSRNSWSVCKVCTPERLAVATLLDLTHQIGLKNAVLPLLQPQSQAAAPAFVPPTKTCNPCSS